MKITEAELSKRKQRIIHTAFELFCKNGIDQVTVKDIAESAHVGEKSIYRYFHTKRDLMLATQSKLWKEIVEGLCSVVNEQFHEQNGYTQVSLLLEGFRNLFESYQAYVVFSYECKLFLIRHNTQMTQDEYDEFQHPLHQQFLKSIELGQADGTISKDMSAEDMYIALWGLLRGYVAKIVLYEQIYAGKNPWEGRFEIACRLLMKSLRAV